ncbi:ATP-grasp peptide maturase system methyltransferase [Streptomyces sp. NPDC053069]|uniref:ATP-grasp peptide maturase system methyltransferase n=1 Tax=Streptomyces sp. NPDC053069 TaxID=3365695 RepID=UPI0037D60175
MNTEVTQLHQRLVDSLQQTGALRTEPWRRAVESVPRHEFLRSGFFRRVPNAFPAAWQPVLEGSADWMRGCFADESLVTQIANTIVPSDIRGEILREPTSSSTLPSLVVRMLEELRAEPGMRVLEIGTGTGYSTALLCARLGEGAVTSIEYDKEVAARAQTALGRIGMYPTLITGDGLRGFAKGAPYDRIIATCGVRTVPSEWIEQARPGGEILTTIGGWLGTSELARLAVHDDGTASGPLLGGRVSFMLARPQLPPPLGLLPDLSAGEERPATVGADALDGWASRFVVQSALPGGQRLTMERDGLREEVLIDVDSGSWAALYEENGRWTVRQDGPHALWDAAEDQLGRWYAAGAPELERFTLRVTPEGQSYSW